MFSNEANKNVKKKKNCEKEWKGISSELRARLWWIPMQTVVVFSKIIMRDITIERNIISIVRSNLNQWFYAQMLVTWKDLSVRKSLPWFHRGLCLPLFVFARNAPNLFKLRNGCRGGRSSFHKFSLVRDEFTLTTERKSLLCLISNGCVLWRSICVRYAAAAAPPPPAPQLGFVNVFLALINFQVSSFIASRSYNTLTRNQI